MEYIEFRFSSRHTNFSFGVNIEKHVIPQVSWFKSISYKMRRRHETYKPYDLSGVDQTEEYFGCNF